MTLDPAATYAAIRSGVTARRSSRDVVSVTGPDARSYLQGQCSQDLDALVAGESAESLVLSPQGKLDAFVSVLAQGDESFLLVVAGGFGEALLERLARFKLRVKAELSLETVPVVELRGPQAAPLAGAPALRVEWPGYAGWDLLGTAELPEGVNEGAPEAFEAARIEAGLPEMGSELDEATIPPEAGIVARSVSFTKGCFTGQELVARLDARGNRTPRNLRALLLPAGASAPPGTELFAGDKVVGRLTSVAARPDGALVALGYLRREVVPPAEVAVGAPGAALTAEVRELPLAG
ncbi:MAG TPA: hypothetical protein VNF07_06405 [Acidimicrobiales bacterium]|nr:hypothetical protein [Acidimicrobiales bacterium]